MAIESLFRIYIYLVNISISVAYDPLKLTGMNLFLCYRVIQFIAALYLQIALKVHL
jgi:hypothetical protein